MQIRFSYDTKYGRFSDALNLPDDHTYTENDIELMKEARRDAWISYIDSTQVESTPVTGETPLENTTEP